MKAGNILLAVTFGLGLLIGIQSGGEPETKYKVIHHTKTVTETQTVTVPETPDACREVVKYAKVAIKSARHFDMTNANVLDIMSESRIANMAGDSSTMNVLDTKLRRLSSKHIESTRNLSEVLEPFAEAQAACLEASQ